MIANLTTATPVAIDTELAAWWTERYKEQDAATTAWNNVVSYVGHMKQNWSEKATAAEVREFLAEHAEISEDDEMIEEAYGYRNAQYARSAWKNYLKHQTHATAADEILADEIQTLEAEFTRRGGWTRAYLVVNNGTGHVHTSMHCSTTYATTRFVWMVDYSDKTQAEIIDAAGERACTVCYPDAPVGVTGTRMFTPDEIAAQAAREERAAKKAKAEAAKITVTWIDDYRYRQGEREFKTLRGLTNELSSLIDNLVWYGERHPSGEAWLANLNAGREIAEAQGWDYDKALAAKRKKATKEGCEPKF